MGILSTDTDIASLLRRTRTIAVVGLSATLHRDSHRVALYLQQQGYVIIPVNPTVREVLGQAAFPDVKVAQDLPCQLQVLRQRQYFVVSLFHIRASIADDTALRDRGQRAPRPFTSFRRLRDLRGYPPSSIITNPAQKYRRGSCFRFARLQALPAGSGK